MLSAGFSRQITTKGVKRPSCNETEMLLPGTMTKVLLLAHWCQGAKPGRDTSQKQAVNSYFKSLMPHFEPYETTPSLSRAEIIVLGLICQVKKHWSNCVWTEQESHKIPNPCVPELNTEQEHIPLTSCSSPGTATGCLLCVVAAL